MTQAIASPAVHDLIGIGFGPSNLALAIALQEREKAQGKLDVLFLDKQADYRWHGNTLVTQSELQISFLKDLVTLRNPTSPYSFVNYLKAHNRLVDFINLGTFYPCRMEFNDYLRWVAGQFQAQSRYGEEVLAIEPILHHQQVDALRVISRDARGEQHVRTTRSVVVIGGGQSAAEAFVDLNDSFPSVHVDMILRGSALKPADDSPFVNEVFSPAFTDRVFQQVGAERERLLAEYQNTNYSVVDLDLIERIYGIFYRQKVSGTARQVFRTLTVVEHVSAGPLGIELALRNNATGETSVSHYDAVILATGYERQMHRELLAPLEAYMSDFEVSRDYRIVTDERCKAGIYIQGFSQASHGLSDTLLSVLPIRADEIAASRYAHDRHRGQGRSVQDLLLATAS